MYCFEFWVDQYTLILKLYDRKQLRSQVLFYYPKHLPRKNDKKKDLVIKGIRLDIRNGRL